MNRKKRGRNAAEFGLTNRPFGEKSNIAARRLTIRPGFINKAIASDTIKRSKQSETPARNQDNILSEDPHSFFHQSKNPRRSERILKKHFENNNSTSLKSNSDTFKPSATPPTSQTQVSVPQQNPKCKAIVRNTSKSIFKEINEKYATVGNQNITRHQEISQRLAENQGFNLNLNGIREKHDILNLDDNSCKNKNDECRNNALQNQVDKSSNHCADAHNIFEVPSSLQNFNGFPEKNEMNNNVRCQEAELLKKPVDNQVNKSFCNELENQISVKLKKNERIDVFHRINEEIEKTNLILEGKLQYTDMYSSERYQPKKPTEEEDSVTELYTLFPRQLWSFRTPPRQKLGAPPIQETQRQTGVLYSNNVECNLYEFQPNVDIEVIDVQEPNNVPIDNRFLKSIAQAKRNHIGNFQFGENMQVASNYYLGEARQNQVPNFYNGTNGFVNYVDVNPEQQVECPAFYIPRPYENMKIYPTNFQFHPPQPVQNIYENEFTFVEENGGFRIQETQKGSHQNNNFFVKPTNTSVSANLFHFNQIENRNTNNLFNFNEVRI